MTVTWRDEYYDAATTVRYIAYADETDLDATLVSQNTALLLTLPIVKTRGFSSRTGLARRHPSSRRGPISTSVTSGVPRPSTHVSEYVTRTLTNSRTPGWPHSEDSTPR